MVEADKGQSTCNCKQYSLAGTPWWIYVLHLLAILRQAILPAVRIEICSVLLLLTEIRRHKFSWVQIQIKKSVVAHNSDNTDHTVRGAKIWKEFPGQLSFWKDIESTTQLYFLSPYKQANLRNMAVLCNNKVVWKKLYLYFKSRGPYNRNTNQLSCVINYYGPST